MIITGERKSLCRACKQMRPAKTLHHEHNGRMYCSQGCAAKAAWIFSAIPRQRQAS